MSPTARAECGDMCAAAAAAILLVLALPLAAHSNHADSKEYRSQARRSAIKPIKLQHSACIAVS
jgi:hypothetical protein